MSKATGLGDNFYYGGTDLSGKTNSLSKISGSRTVLDMTDITESAFERQLALCDGNVAWVSYFDPAVGGIHSILSALPRTDVQIMYCRGTALGNPAAAMVSKEIDYAPTRATSGAFTFNVTAQSNSFGLEWGKLQTAGKRTDTTATNGTGVDWLASTAFGMQAYLQVFAFTGTDITIKLQDSADNVTFTDLASAAFTQVTTAPGTQRIFISNAATVRRYVRVSTVTTGGFTTCTFAVMMNRNTLLGQVF